MLLTKNQIASLKKNKNVSKNADKTKERVQADFKAAARADKKAIVELSGQVENSIYRIYNTGSINARILLAMAQVLKIQPWYYSGEIDERNPLDEGQIGQFLKVHGYDELSRELGKTPAKRKYERKPKPETPPVVVTEEVASDESAPVAGDTPPSEAACECEDKTVTTTTAKEVKLLLSDEPQMKKAVDELTEQEAVELLHTLFIRAKGGGEAAELADIVKRCLLK